jgi:hypothetical protein
MKISCRILWSWALRKRETARILLSDPAADPTEAAYDAMAQLLLGLTGVP